MIPTLDKNSTTDEMVSAVVKNGVFKIDNYLSDTELKVLTPDILNKCTRSDDYEFGKAYRDEGLLTHPEGSILRLVYDVQWMKDLYHKYTGTSSGYGMGVFATHDYKFNGELARNGWLHFDRLWKFKFFIYLTNVDKSSGAFTCCPGSREKGLELRQEASRGSKYEGVKNRIELDYPELLDIFPQEPVEAEAGTLIVFDTNTFHKGGQVEDGKERLIVRLHCG